MRRLSVEHEVRISTLGTLTYLSRSSIFEFSQKFLQLSNFIGCNLLLQQTKQIPATLLPFILSLIISLFLPEIVLYFYLIFSFTHSLLNKICRTFLFFTVYTKTNGIQKKTHSIWNKIIIRQVPGSFRKNSRLTIVMDRFETV